MRGSSPGWWWLCGGGARIGYSVSAKASVTLLDRVIQVLLYLDLRLQRRPVFFSFGIQRMILSLSYCAISLCFFLLFFNQFFFRCAWLA